MSTSKTPMISVIMGIYNCQDTLAEAMDSLLNQSYQDFEIVLCNDGSKDNTLAVAKDY
ncbi:MAG: glycosyltransferase, partial [Oscillospiraceae bacterium]|nr:glycosyltransferase [Oscillospiraceae bacterium]